MAIRYAASAGWADIQAQITASSNGDEVVVPATGADGISWTSGISNEGKAITIRGAGVGQTIIIDNITNRNNGFVGISALGLPPLQYRLTGFEFRNSTASEWTYGAINVTGTNRLSGNSQWRIDNCKIVNCPGRPVYAWAIAGLIDNVEIIVTGAQGGMAADGRAGTDGSNEKGHRTWANPVQVGTSDEGIFFEDSSYTVTGSRRAATDAFAGASWVVRRCTMVNASIENHGTESTGVFRGGRWLAVLDCNLGGAGGGEYLIHSRSGSGVIRGNTCTGGSPGLLRMIAQRETTNFNPYLGAFGTNGYDSNSPTIFGTGVVTSAPVPDGFGMAIQDSSQSWITNQWVGHHIRNTITGIGSIVISNTATKVVYQTAASGVMAMDVGTPFEFRKVLQSLDQPGVGTGDLLVGGTNSPPVGPTNPSTAPGDPWPRQAVEPFYYWNNTGPVQLISNNGHYTIVPGVHYKNEPHPTYVEYTYPHPLRGGVAAPTWLINPVSSSVAVGANLTFSVAASGNPAPTYQWRKNGGNISGATSASLALTNIQLTAAGTYDCVATNSQGSATSTAAVLTVTADVGVAPVITTQPASASVNYGEPFSLSVIATGTAPISYQWRLAGSNISGAIASGLSVSSATETGVYDCVVTNAYGSVTSTAATITVIPPSPTPSTGSPLGNRGSCAFIIGALGAI